VHIWDPPTNTLNKCTNVLNGDFIVSDDTSRIAASASPSALFDYFARHNQIAAIDSLVPLENLRPLAELHRRSADSHFQSLCTEIFDLCPPTAWRFVLGVFADVWRSEGEVQAVIVKRFPDLYFAVREGSEVVIGNAVREFVDLCRPLSVNVQQRTADELLRMVEELSNIILVAR
jgi:hypothetical protein